MLSDEILLTADGGGKVNVVREITRGMQATIDLLFYLYSTYQKLFEVKYQEINHPPGLLYSKDGKLISCLVFEFDPTGQKIRHIYSIVDPDKLKNLPGSEKIVTFSCSRLLYW